MRSHPQLPLATHEADPEVIIRKGKASDDPDYFRHEMRAEI
jgi:hypothetical protein